MLCCLIYSQGASIVHPLVLCLEIKNQKYTSCVNISQQTQTATVICQDTCSYLKKGNFQASTYALPGGRVCSFESCPFYFTRLMARRPYSGAFSSVVVDW